MNANHRYTENMYGEAHKIAMNKKIDKHNKMVDKLNWLVNKSRLINTNKAANKKSR